MGTAHNPNAPAPLTEAMRVFVAVNDSGYHDELYEVGLYLNAEAAMRAGSEDWAAQEYHTTLVWTLQERRGGHGSRWYGTAEFTDSVGNECHANYYISERPVFA